ncbi:CHAP domain-containing protein [Mycobacterium sp. THU-M104]|uniref:CHAP domain-containing protein n=1 Tax=Mycobacterium sp. THU-M104 TaxID=3410515 RepID=UPI003B9C5133
MGFEQAIGGKSASLRQARMLAGRSALRVGVTTATVLTAGGLVFAASVGAEPAATVKARTQRMSEPSPNARQDGWYDVDDRLVLVCSTRGQATTLWYKTSDGHFVSGVDIETRTQNAATPDCAGQFDPAGAPAGSPGRAMGQRRSVNSGAEGQCTWGALQKWFEAGGYYPALQGNAMDWADSARAHGWTVVTDPQPRAIVVFEPWLPGVSPYGHAAWVNSVSERGDGIWVNITEMNNATYGGAGQWWTRDARNVPGMSYILMP